MLYFSNSFTNQTKNVLRDVGNPKLHGNMQNMYNSVHNVNLNLLTKDINRFPECQYIDFSQSIIVYYFSRHQTL